MEEMPERGEIRQQIAELKDAIRKLGNVNVNAIEEYKEISGTSRILPHSIPIWWKQQKR